ncbi:methylated-DNA--[protein]-cysteine S-methyltransferase [Tengunoibacter tsumagoiensis]|uniref:Methylated-DNA--protein-cysteine methyltransferase n=1 Tax=Tengunoibacter tsumagoiensis TaxID=2014871 RepID=A0A401ZUP0_9CHLR|nr:methylated-DNA--[protein]-cysteine S-methyltransferase [Tengunoibacter tsumagoiensis]GCE10668.1 methylated-DNA--protein-cysteine methyltransferase [Tengunoibacter tsumagoiensis]
MKTLLFDRLETPELGIILLVVDGDQLCALDYSDYEGRMLSLLKKRYGSVELLPTPNPCGYSQRVQAYLAGDYEALDSIPVNPGGTEFQRQVWLALRSIPVGSTISYGELAARLDRPKASRAVGGTNALNPIAIVLPCHRVIGANRSLTGYAGGLHRKQWLLKHENFLAHTFCQ